MIQYQEGLIASLQARIITPPKSTHKTVDKNSPEFIEHWQKEYHKFIDGEITKEEYDQWRYNYPEKAGTGFKRIVQL